MFFHQRFVPGLAIYSYLVGDERSGEAAVIDPTRDVDEFVSIAHRHGLHIKHTLETHVHADFLSGSRELKDRLGESLTIHSSGLAGPEWTPAYADRVVNDGDEVLLGTLRLKAFHTPGHTGEHLTWTLFDDARSREVPWLAMTGDFLFVGDVGRPDLLGKEAQQALAHQLYQSIFEKLPAIPDFTEIFPAHGAGSLCGKALGSRASSTVGYERRFNGALVQRAEKEWVETLLSGMPIAPPYFRRMKEMNRKGPAVLGHELPGQKRLSAREVHQRVCESCVILDVRSKEAFAGGHIPGSINIPFGSNLATWAGWVMPYDRPILLVLDHSAHLAETTTQLIRIGLDEVRGYLEGSFEAWANAGYEQQAVGTLDVHRLHRRLKESERLTVLDVRTEREFAGGHIDGALHIHAGKLPERLADVPHDKPVAVICGSGYRASIASSFLLREGFTEISNVLGGMGAWKAAELPTVASPAQS
jgi:hydroxyacylglutathione hydrolase